MFIKNKLKLFLVLSFALLTLTGCSMISNKNLTSLSKMNISQVKDNNLLEIINNLEDEEGIYLVQSNSEQYIIFNGVDNSYYNISSRLNEDTLEVSTMTNSNDSKNQKQIYKVKTSKSKPFNSISIVKDGQDISFDNLFVD